VIRIQCEKYNVEETTRASTSCPIHAHPRHTGNTFHSLSQPVRELTWQYQEMQCSTKMAGPSHVHLAIPRLDTFGDRDSAPPARLVDNISRVQLSTLSLSPCTMHVTAVLWIARSLWLQSKHTMKSVIPSIFAPSFSAGDFLPTVQIPLSNLNSNSLLRDRPGKRMHNP
jgi:hypothetical protein